MDDHEETQNTKNKDPQKYLKNKNFDKNIKTLKNRTKVDFLKYKNDHKSLKKYGIEKHYHLWHETYE